MKEKKRIGPMNRFICLSTVMLASFELSVAVSNSEYFELSSLANLNGFSLTGITSNGFTGASVSGAGDVNGDGIDDFLVGAYGESSSAGATYVIFGSTTIHTNVAQNGTLDLSKLDGSNGFVINGVDASDQSAISISSAGDFNKDGFADIVIGAWFANTLVNILKYNMRLFAISVSFCDCFHLLYTYSRDFLNIYIYLHLTWERFD